MVQGLLGGERALDNNAVAIGAVAIAIAFVLVALWRLTGIEFEPAPTVVMLSTRTSSGGWDETIRATAVRRAACTEELIDHVEPEALREAGEFACRRGRVVRGDIVEIKALDHDGERCDIDYDLVFQCVEK